MELDPRAQRWLSKTLGTTYTAHRHAHAHQDDVYTIETQSDMYYLKISDTLQAEHDNLQKLETIVNVPRVMDFYSAGTRDYLLLSVLPGKNLVELIADWPQHDIVHIFANAVRQLHTVNTRNVFPQAGPHDVLLHGDMALPNILVSERGDIGYIDFGQLSYGMPELDLADALWSLQRNLGPAYGEIFLETYGPVVMTPKLRAALDYRYEPPEEA